MKRRLLAAAALLMAAAWINVAYAQQVAPTVLPSGCGTGLYSSSTSGALTSDTAGRLCGNMAFLLSHAATAALANNLNVKAASGNLFSFNCTAITGAAAGYCIAYNGSTTPGTGALTAANVIDFCFFDTTAKGCSINRIPAYIAFSSGIQILVSSAVSPYTYTTGTDTAAISADFQ